MIKGVLIDLGGVVFVGNAALPGAIDAIARLKAARMPVRYLSNTTRRPQRVLIDDLAGMGLAVSAEELLLPAVAARAHLKAQGLKPLLLAQPALAEDLAGLAGERGRAVVVGDAGEGFTYPALNGAFRALMDGAAFIALAANRSFRDADGKLSLDVGAFVAALEYASGRSATVLGKPSADFFESALASLGCAAAEAVMIGDDVESDVGGAMALGMSGILVRTGKYEPGAEDRIDPPPTAVVDDLAAAVDLVLAGPGR